MIYKIYEMLIDILIDEWKKNSVEKQGAMLAILSLLAIFFVFWLGAFPIMMICLFFNPIKTYEKYHELIKVIEAKEAAKSRKY